MISGTPDPTHRRMAIANMNRVAAAAHSLGVPGTAAEDQVKLGKIKILHRERIEHEVLPKVLLHSRQPLHGRGANVSAAQFFRQTVRQGYGCIDWGGRERLVHGSRHALGATHLNEVVMNECDL